MNDDLDRLKELVERWEDEKEYEADVDSIFEWWVNRLRHEEIYWDDNYEGSESGFDCEFEDMVKMLENAGY